MTEGGAGTNRRRLVAGMIAAIAAPPPREPLPNVNDCAEALARALAARHGGRWRIYIDSTGLLVTVAKEFPRET